MGIPAIDSLASKVTERTLTWECFVLHFHLASYLSFLFSLTWISRTYRSFSPPTSVAVPFAAVQTHRPSASPSLDSPAVPVPDPTSSPAVARSQRGCCPRTTPPLTTRTTTSSPGCPHRSTASLPATPSPASIPPTPTIAWPEWGSPCYLRRSGRRSGCRWWVPSWSLPATRTPFPRAAWNFRRTRPRVWKPVCEALPPSPPVDDAANPSATAASRQRTRQGSSCLPSCLGSRPAHGSASSRPRPCFRLPGQNPASCERRPRRSSPSPSSGSCDLGWCTPSPS
mmetsp:Transcript_52329/g.111205  ORF Transcript_52329/g.111205 Transcript_52329/m.111205 type:complete len:283 (+) Transcript_52329:113-961(+)